MVMERDQSRENTKACFRQVEVAGGTGRGADHLLTVSRGLGPTWSAGVRMAPTRGL